MNAMGAGSQIQESCSSHCFCAFSCTESHCTKCLGCKASEMRNLGSIDPAGERALRSAFRDEMQSHCAELGMECYRSSPFFFLSVFSLSCVTCKATAFASIPV